MELVEMHGDLFDSAATILCHQVNCCGCIGGGISGQFIAHEPKIIEEYRNVCASTVMSDINGMPSIVPKADLLGSVIFTKHGKDQIYASIFGQLEFGGDFKQYTDYDAVESGLMKIRQYAEENDPYISSIAIPKYMGCGLGGARWSEVKSIIERVFDGYDGVLEIWEYV